MRPTNLSIMSYPIVTSNPGDGVEVVEAAVAVEAAEAVAIVKAAQTHREAPSTKIKEATNIMEVSVDTPKATTEIDVHTKIEVEREGRAHPV